MNAYYETNRDKAGDIHVSRSRNHTYPSHFHMSAELFAVRHGHYSLTINGTAYEMTDGCVAFIDCYDIHSYERLEEGGDDCVAVIPYTLTQRFNEKREGRRIITPVIEDASLCERLLTLADGFLIGKGDDGVKAATAELMLALMLGELSLGEERERGEGQLIRRILCYIQEKFRGELTRTDISRALGYSPEHISRIFHKYLGRSLNDYVNSLRLEYIDYQRRREGAPSLTALVYEAGFGSEQTYYRARRRQGARP